MEIDRTREMHAFEPMPISTPAATPPRASANGMADFLDDRSRIEQTASTSAHEQVGVRPLSKRAPPSKAERDGIPWYDRRLREPDLRPREEEPSNTVERWLTNPKLKTEELMPPSEGADHFLGELLIERGFAGPP